jgi:release factor glutamine methyltransferase
MTIQDVIMYAKDHNVDVLDAELLLADILEVKQAFVLAHPESVITKPQEIKLLSLLDRRSLGEPLAYLTGVKEFFDLPLLVNKNVLVPRPESEEAIEWILEKTKKQMVHSILDVGTGSGALALALAKHLPKTQVEAIDTKEKILDVARKNAKELGINNISFIKSNLLEKIDPEKKFDVVIANLPYLSTDWQRDPSTKYEPEEALYANENGLGLYRQLLKELPNYLQDNAFGIFEADPRNAEALCALTQEGLPDKKIMLKNDLAGLARFVTFEK